MTEPLVFAIVCDVCNAPIMDYVPDNGMARCEACQKQYDIDQALMDDYQPDEPCDHEWAPTHEGSDHFACIYCGQYYV